MTNGSKRTPEHRLYEKVYRERYKRKTKPLNEEQKKAKKLYDTRRYKDKCERENSS